MLFVSLAINIILLFTLLACLFLYYKQRLKIAAMNAEFALQAQKKQSLNKTIIQLKNKIEHEKGYDHLTGMPARPIFEDRVQQAIHQSDRYQLRFAILFLRLDGLEIINNALGLAAGDILLKKVAERFKRLTRQVDTTARLSGSEFAFLLPQLSKPEGAGHVALRLLNMLAEPFTIEDQTLFITACIGIVVFPTDGNSVHTLMKNAISAMHQAKAHGTHHYQFYNQEMHALSYRELLLSSELSSEHVFKHFVIYYQPEMEIESKKIKNIEALLRWEHPDYGWLEFKDFVHLAENRGNIVALSEWLLRTTLLQYKTWQAMQTDMPLLIINLSAKVFENPHFIYRFTQLLSELKVVPTAFMLSISEMMFSTKFSMIEKTLRMLKQQGIKIRLSDFGAGHISLKYLQNFSIDSLKISSILVKDMLASKDASAIVKMLVMMGASLGVEVVASGVDTSAQMELLAAMGCHCIQGNYVGPAVLAQEMLIGNKPSFVI